jgi:uncharacterized membrane protein YccC
VDDGPVNPLPAGWPAGPPAPTILQQDRSAPGKPAGGRSSAIERRVNVHSEAPPLRARIYSPLAAAAAAAGASLRSLLQARAHNDDDAGSTRQTYDTFIHSVSRAAPMDVRPILLQIRRTCHFQSARRPYGTRIAVGCCCFC